MRQTKLDRRHEDRSEIYKRHISNIAFRFGLTVDSTDGGVVTQTKDGVTTIVLSREEYKQPHQMWWKAWLKLSREYGYSGIWRDRDA